MDIASLIRAMENAFHHLGQHWTTKAVIAAIVGAAYSMHAQLLLAFIGLVVLDLITKWISLSYAHLAKRRRKNKPTLMEAFRNIPKARAAGYIKSTIMKDRFLGKILVYLLIVLAGGFVDAMLDSLKQQTWAVLLCVGYLSATELLSILENLQDAGVEQAGALHSLVEKRKDLIK